MPIYVDHEDKLNWTLWALFGLWLASGSISKWAPWLGHVSVGVSAIALIWVLSIFWWRLNHVTDEKVIYRRPTNGDYWRLFVVLWLSPIATLSPTSFLVMSLVTVPVFFLLITIGITDWALEKSLSARAIACFAFAYFLFGWQRSALAKHYGVPIIGHFLEEPNFDAQYDLDIRGVESGREYKVLADIRVESYSETVDTGSEDFFGNSTSATFRGREIWIKRMRFPNGSLVDVDYQDCSFIVEVMGFPFTMFTNKGKSYPIENYGGYISDSHGQEWFVDRITDRRVD